MSLQCVVFSVLHCRV